MSEWRPLGGTLAGWTCGEGPRLVFVHGFTQTANSWKEIAARVAEDGYESIVVDAPGHGDSVGARGDLRRGTDLLTALCGFAVYVGYSMGGRLCMHAAIMHPHLVRGLALVSASPGIEGVADRAARRAADDKLADHIEDVGVSVFVDEWLAQPLFAGMTVDDDERADRLRNTPEGLASSLRDAGTGAQGSLWARLHELTMPVLTIAGERDEKFSAIGRQIASSVPHGEFVGVPAAGHAPHLEDVDAVFEALTKWLAQLSW